MEQNPENNGLLYVGKDSDLSSVYIVTKDFVQENEKFWLTVRFVFSEISQSRQNYQNLLKERGIDYNNLDYIEEFLEFDQNHLSFSELYSSYKDIFGKTIYQSVNDDPQWIPLEKVSRTGIVRQVYEITMSQLVNLENLNASQEQMKSPNNNPSQIHDKSFPIINSANQPATFGNRINTVFVKLLAMVGGIIFIIPAVRSCQSGASLSDSFSIFLLTSVIIIGLIVFWAMVTHTNISLYGWVKASPRIKELLSHEQIKELEKVRKEFQIKNDEFNLLFLSSLAFGRKIIKRDYKQIKKLYPDWDEKATLKMLLLDDLKKDPDWSDKSSGEINNFVEEAMKEIDNLNQLCTFIEKLDYPKNQLFYDSALSKKIEKIIGKSILFCPKCGKEGWVSSSRDSKVTCPYCNWEFEVST